ncbi:DUF4328 domain-containing protein [Streptomyces sp. NPDC087300]|uniref:DUF4328 domain-containing protein n=1 Tax=Streptomyces sp. NPDC087300 TaxID=3365780 RepID=UPI003811D546
MNERITAPALSPIRGAARLAVAALVLAGTAWAARALWQIRLAAAGQPPSGPPDQGDGQHRPLTALENTYHFVSTLGDVTTVLCAIAFLAWLWRARDNALAFSGRPLRDAGPWVYAGWIVPIVNLWIPRRIIADVHRASAPDDRLPWVVNWWWGLWLVSILSGTGLMFTDTSTDAVIARAYTNVSPLLLVDAAVVGAAATGVMVVRALTAAQQKRMR